MTAESSDNKEDGAKAVALTFSMQGIGYLSAPVIGWLQVSLFPNNPELIWRLLLGAGCIPGGWLMALRVRRQFNRVKSLEGTAAGKAQIHVNTREVPVSIMDAIKLEENLVQKMLGTGGCWLLFDILFYGNTLFQPVVLAAAFGNSETIQNAARDTSLISAMALPGYFFSVVAVGHQSPRFIQAQGFLMMGILYTFIGTCENRRSKLLNSSFVSVCPTRSETHKSVMTIPDRDTTPHTIMTVSCPNRAAAVTKIIVPSRAPVLPQAAHTPFSVDRQGRENVMDGSI